MINEDQGKVLSDLAASGDATAKGWASELGIEPKPVTSGDEKKEQGGAADDAKLKVEPKTDGDGPGAGGTNVKGGTDSEVKDGVDAHRDGASGSGGGPDARNAMRRLKQERRQLRMERDASRQREEELNKRLAALEAQAAKSNGQPAKDAEEDELVKLLTKPKDFLRERDQNLIAAVREALKEDLAKARAAEEGKAQKTSAIKTLESIKDFDLERDEEEVFEIMEKEYGLDEDDVAHLLSTRPEKTANLIKRAWEKGHSLALDDKAKSDKAAAKAVGPAGGGSSHSKTDLATINARAKGAKSKEDLEALWEEAGKLS